MTNTQYSERYAIVQVAGDWTRRCTVEDGAEAGWFLLYITSQEGPAYIYDSNTGDLVRGDGEPVPYGSYNIDWI